MFGHVSTRLEGDPVRVNISKRLLFRCQNEFPSAVQTLGDFKTLPLTEPTEWIQFRRTNFSANRESSDFLFNIGAKYAEKETFNLPASKRAPERGEQTKPQNAGLPRTESSSLTQKNTLEVEA